LNLTARIHGAKKRFLLVAMDPPFSMSDEVLGGDGPSGAQSVIKPDALSANHDRSGLHG